MLGNKPSVQNVENNVNNIPLVLARYQREIKPIAAGYQNSANGMRPFFLDRRQCFEVARNSVLRFTPEWLMKGAMRRFYQAEGA